MARRRQTSNGVGFIGVVLIFGCVIVYNKFEALDHDSRQEILIGVGSLIAFLAIMLTLRWFHARKDQTAINRRSMAPAPPILASPPLSYPQPQEAVGRVQKPFGHAKPTGTSDIPIVVTRQHRDVLIIYESNARSYTARRVTIHGVTGHKSQTGEAEVELLDGYCHTQCKNISFKMNRIRHIADQQTGAPIQDLAAWLKLFEPHQAATIENQSLPETHTDSELAVTKIGEDALLRYKDSAGHDTERRITIQSVDGHYDKSGRPHIEMINAYCHVRKMPRSFRMDRVEMIADPETGEIIADPIKWLGIALH